MWVTCTDWRACVLLLKEVDAPQPALDCVDSDFEIEDDPEHEINDHDDVDDGQHEHNGVAHEPADLVPVAKKRNVRSPTKMKSIFATKGAVKIFVKINRYGQPCGV